MKQVKKHIAISFWGVLCLFLFYRYHLDSLIKSEEQKAISTTNQKIKEYTQKIHQSELKKADLEINKNGNYYRDTNLFNDIKNAYSSIKKLDKTDQMNLTNLKLSLTDSASKHITTQTPSPVHSNSETLKSIYKTNLYQSAYNLLSQEYSMFYRLNASKF